MKNRNWKLFGCMLGAIAGGMMLFPSEARAAVDFGWEQDSAGRWFWYENGERQGTEGRGKEIYDPGSDAWYWLDSVDGGKKAVSKDVYQESAAGKWAENADGTGKWVRYDAEGHMIKGWDTNENGTYYFDLIYGTMAKGTVEIEDKVYHFDEALGICLDTPPKSGLSWEITDDGQLIVVGSMKEPPEWGWYGGEWFWGLAPWFGRWEECTSAYINIKDVTSLSYFFSGMENLETVDLSKLDTSQVTTMGYMFFDCRNLKTLDLSGLDTSQVTTMRGMFAGCRNLKTLDLSGLDTSQVTDMGGMFMGCSSLDALDLSGFDTSQVMEMEVMFVGCSSLKTLDLSSFDTSHVYMKDVPIVEGNSECTILIGPKWDLKVRSNMIRK